MTPQELEVQVATRIRDLRIALGLTQTDIAIRLECTKAYVSQIETGHCSIGLGQLAKIANAFGVKPEVFIAERPIASPQPDRQRKSLAVS